MRIGAHVRDDDLLDSAAERGAEVVQFFLSDPQSWKAPTPHPEAEALRTSDVSMFVHAPYVINVASLNNRIRIPSRKAVAPNRCGTRAQNGRSVSAGRNSGSLLMSSTTTS